MPIKKIGINNNKECCGCTACESVCSHNAISMCADTLGFLYPKVDVNKCIECGLCEKVCQFHQNYYLYNNYDEAKVFSLRLKDIAQLAQSQSGGAFWGLAQRFIQDGGVVYGAAFEDTWKVTHQRAYNIDDLEKLRMSKYVQSDMRGVYKLIKDDLKQGHKVLFSGTACQVAGLKAYLPQKLHDNLFCIDIICHGVPSPKIWADYIEYLQHKHKSKIIKACFRDKRFGWHGAKESFMFANGKEVFSGTSNGLYFSGYTVRESCSNCYYTNTRRVGDITIGDHWGLPKDSPYEKDALGVSLVLVNSDQGKDLLYKVLDKFNFKEVDIVNCLQSQLKYPCKLNPNHECFVSDYKNKGFLYIAKKYGDLSILWKLKGFLTKFKGLLKQKVDRFQ